MVVTARTSDGHAEKGLADRVDLLVHNFQRQQLFVLATVVVWTQNEQPGGRELVREFGVAGKRQEITGNMFADQLVQRFVMTKCLDHVVAQTPCIRQRLAAATTCCVGITDDVQPVPCPALGEGA